MLKTYLITIVLFYLSFALMFTRYFVNKDKIVSHQNKDKWFTYIRLLILSLMPVINILATIFFIKFAVFDSNENFIKMLNE
ncbi:hypothetical protein FDF29_12020 [Clostridium botulinum]|uniref:Phage protein n=2 Tax=Clostridium botulinum TaxID=1491 RepID=A5I2J6_CLOBH|nr:phage protein [Clostridium botulinum]NEZ93696.1 hypothetical protein [Clostridium botulinum]NFL68403.1 hypothetical protein [Clostridium botulinum]NFQ52582.1 hypothetical protein [Clostridium botulinum]NFT46962.1 hypothetical protein [Clostridium botulinum]QGT42448.1 hypothetical protein GJ703_00625 [Clostridium botulinum]